MRSSIAGALAAAGVGAGDPAALAAAVAAQWASCGVLLPYGPALGLTSPYLKDVPLPAGAAGFPFDPEMCKYVADAASAQVGAPVAPADFPAAGLAVDASAAAAFLTLAIGASDATYLDPAAAGFVGAFMTLPRGALLGAAGAAAPAAAAALAAVPEAQWPLFQGYLMSLIPTWGTLVLEGWLAAGGGGLIVTKPVSAWLHGFDDPLLKAAAEGAAAAAGAPGAERLAPWTYRPALALTFEAEATPTDYFSNVTGTEFDVSMLSWNASAGPGFHPLVQQKRLATGRAEGEAPQVCRVWVLFVEFAVESCACFAIYYLRYIQTRSLPPPATHQHSQQRRRRFARAASPSRRAPGRSPTSPARPRAPSSSSTAPRPRAPPTRASSPGTQSSPTPSSSRPRGRRR